MTTQAQERALRRKRVANHIDAAGTTLAVTGGTLVAGERIRDAWKRDQPKKVKALAARAGRFAPAIEEGRTPAAVITAAGVGGGSAWAAQHYRDSQVDRELRNANRRAARAKEARVKTKRTVIAARAPQQGVLAKAYQDQYLRERRRKQTEAGAALGAAAATGGAVHSVKQAGKARTLAAAEQTSRREALLAASGKTTVSLGGGLKAYDQYRQAAASHRAKNPFDPSTVKQHTYKPRGKAPQPPTGKATPGDHAAYHQQARAYEERLKRGEASARAHNARIVDEARRAHEVKVARGAHAAGLRAAFGSGAGAVTLQGSAVRSGEKALFHHRQAQKHLAEAARHSRAFKSRVGVAGGLLATAALAHERKNRRPPARHPYY